MTSVSLDGIKFEIAGVDLSEGDSEIIRDSGVFEITEFDIAGYNWFVDGQIVRKTAVRVVLEGIC